METPTNTPTSKCEECDPFPGKSCSNKSFFNCDHECHTPTTDSKNTKFEEFVKANPEAYGHPIQDSKNSSEKKHFMLVVNRYGSGYLFTDESTFNPEESGGTFEEWRAEAAKAYD